MVSTRMGYGFQMREVWMLSKVGEIVFFVVTKSSGDSCASLEMCVDSWFFPFEDLECQARQESGV